jgi:hypothetical protein
MSLLHRTRDDDTVVRTHDDDTADRDVHDDDVVRTTDDHAADGVAATKTRERTWTFAPGQLISFAAGVGLIALGVVALIRAGIDGSLAEPTVEVLQLSHTAWLGLAEVGVGILLLIAGTGAWGRFLSVPIGAAMVIAGILVVAEPSQMPDELAIERDYGWGLVLLGALVTLASMILPVWRTRKVREVDLRDDRRERRLVSH